jgi:hypothetical protein
MGTTMTTLTSYDLTVNAGAEYSGDIVVAPITASVLAMSML